MRMIRRVFLSATLLGLTACQGFPLTWKAAPYPSDGHEKASRVRLELQDIHYDGSILSGRLLVSPEEGHTRIDKRFIETVAFSLESTKECSTGRNAEFMIVDVFAQPPQEEDILVLEPGYWYGKNIYMPLFDTTPGGLQGPACVEADLVFYTLAHAKGLLHVRAERSPRPAAKSESPPDTGHPSAAGP